MALKQVKNKIIATQKTGKVTKAMEAVSAVKMRKSQERALAGRGYVFAAMKILRELSNSEAANQHPLIQTGTGSKTLLVIVTSDKGLAGNVNSAVLKRCENFLAEADAVDTICVGRKAVEFARRSKLELLEEHTNVSDEVTLSDIAAMTNTVVERYKTGEYQKVLVVYQNFISTFEQAPVMRQVLPVVKSEVEAVMSGIKPKTGVYSDISDPEATPTGYTVEPSPEAVLDALVPQLVQILLYHALIESKACEHSARMVAMKNATDKAKDMVKALTIEYNKERQTAITAEVSEITAGVEAMS